jgi:formylglycine-generating enzyme required for sulfatase activity
MPTVVEWSADCNDDGYVDYGQIIRGDLADADDNGVPDVCVSVPGDYPTIQSAVDAAPLGIQHHISLAPGVYVEAIELKGKPVRIVGGSAASTVIQAPQAAQSSVIRATGEPLGAMIERVTVRGGVAGTALPGTSGILVGGGLCADGSAMVLKDCVVEGNAADVGGGAYFRSCTGMIVGCTFRDNQSSLDGGAIGVSGGTLTVQDTVVEGNDAGGRGGAIYVMDGGAHMLRGMVVTGNFAAVSAGGIWTLVESRPGAQVSIMDTEACGNVPAPNVLGPWIDLGGNELCRCWTDVNDDGVVDGFDVAALLSQWGPSDESTTCDFDASGLVDAFDLTAVLATWGECKEAPVPVITSVSPGSGPDSGGTVVKVTGMNLIGVNSVLVGSTPASNVQVISATMVTAVTPIGPIGPQDVTVVGAAGTATLTGAFSYFAPAPTLSGIFPTLGGTSGGTRITLTGANLDGATSLTIGGVSASNLQVLSPTTVTAVTPAGTAGGASVSITTPSGSATLQNAFHYADGVRPTWATLIEAAPDPSVVTNPALRSAIAATGYAWRVRDTLAQIEMVLVPPGTFNMGCIHPGGSACYSDSLPVHEVTISRPFYLGRYEVTQSEWVARMGTNPSLFRPANGYADWQSRPVENIWWDLIQQFTSLTGTRLPTEAEWEHAYRAGTQTAFHGFAGYPDGTNDPSLLSNIAWFGAAGGYQTRPVGLKLANGFGLHDMAGNVWEYVNDYYASNYYSVSPSTDPPGPNSGQYRVMRGGSYEIGSSVCRASFREWGGNSGPIYSHHIGFRVARDP